MKTIRLILASTSPYRAELLSKLGIDFEAIAPNVEETAQEHETATELVQRLALEKASALRNEKDAIIIGSDQVCVIDGNIIGKPLTRSNAIRQLQQQSGKKVEKLFDSILDWESTTPRLSNRSPLLIPLM